VDAVQAAVEIQQVLRAKNSLLPENRRMEFRIGINLGDVIEEGERIFGDGVNIAARLEGLAEAGGICISGSAFEQIENKLPLHYDYLGEHEVKNITRPVRVYRALMDNGVVKEKGVGPTAQGARRRLLAFGFGGALLIIVGAALWQFVLRPGPAPPARPPVEKADPQKMAYALPDKPSIAVSSSSKSLCPGLGLKIKHPWKNLSRHCAKRACPRQPPKGRFYAYARRAVSLSDEHPSEVHKNKRCLFKAAA